MTYSFIPQYQPSLKTVKWFGRLNNMLITTDITYHIMDISCDLTKDHPSNSVYTAH